MPQLSSRGEALLSFDINASSVASLNQDYRISRTQSIALGYQSSPLRIEAIDDNEDEADETIILSLQENLENVSLSHCTLTLTILDDDLAQSACAGTSDTYLIDLDPSNCTEDIQTVLGVSASYNEQTLGANQVAPSNSIPNQSVGEFLNMGNDYS